MQLNNLQKRCSQLVKKIDKKYQIQRDPQLTVCQLFEELGELVEKVNYKKLRNKKTKKGELEDEFADVFIQLCSLAEFYDINLENSINKKIQDLEKKHFKSR